MREQVLSAGETLLHEAVAMSLKVGLVKPNDHIVVVQMISEAFVVKVRPALCALLARLAPVHDGRHACT